jgi:hypothetical protein
MKKYVEVPYLPWHRRKHLMRLDMVVGVVKIVFIYVHRK